MVARTLLLAGLIAPVALITPTARVRAQVTLDLHALDQRPAAPPPPAARRHAPPPARRATGHPAQHPAPAESPEARAAPSAPSPVPPPPMPPLPTTIPSDVSLPPIVVAPPPGKPEARPPPPVSPTAGGGVQLTDSGLRVLFDPTRTDLTPESEASIRAYAQTHPLTPGASFNVTAYAAGPPDDLSTPRRLSLSRALAVRSVLLASGVPSPQIYVRALGASATGGAPADRVDVAELGTGGAEAKK